MTAPKNQLRALFEQLIKSPLFWAGVVLKLVLIPWGSSGYLTELFIPFMDTALENPGVNPWSLSPPAQFPYGAILFAVLYVPKFLGHLIFGAEALGTTGLSFFLMKIPLLGFDLLLLAALAQFEPQGLRRLLIFFWLNPILIFISYYCGQLDVVCMSFLFWSLYQMTQRKVAQGAILFALAVLCKFHVVLLVPFLMAYLWNNYFLRQALQKISLWLGLVVLVSALGFLPHLLSNNFNYVSGGSPEAQRIFAMTLNLGQQQIYLGVLLVLLLVGRLCLSTRIGPYGLVYGAGALMTLLVLVVNPAEGWFYWYLPFVALLMAQFMGVPRLLLVGVVVSYFSYFVVSNSLGSTSLSNLSLTVLQTFTACLLVSFFVFSLKFEAPILRRWRPLLIGIGGDSGAGKNYLSTKIQDLFGTQGTQVLEGDDYHKWERGDLNWQKLTHLNPMANRLEDLIHHSRLIGRGRSIFTPHYDHNTGKFTMAREIPPAKTVIVQGLHSLFMPELRENLDLRIFLKPSEQVRKEWKIQRDVNERGHSEQKVIAALASRAEDSGKFIQPQEKSADWCVSYDKDSQGNFRISHRVRNWPGLIRFLDSLKSLKLELSLNGLDPDFIEFEVKGSPAAAAISEWAESHLPSLRQVLRVSTPPRWSGGLDGVNQLILVYLISSQSKDDQWA